MVWTPGKGGSKASQDYYEKAKKEYKKDDHHPGQGSNTYKKKDTTPKEVKTGNARDDWRANQGLRNIQDQQAKKAAADAARADIIKRSQTGNVDREDYRGGRHKYGMSVDDYHNMMGTVPQKKYGEMFPYSAGIPNLFNSLGNFIPGLGFAKNILKSINGSDLGKMTGDLIGTPELVSRGFVLMDASTELLEATQNAVSRIVTETPIEEKQDQELFNEILRKGLKRFLRKQTGKRPIILPLTIEI